MEDFYFTHYFTQFQSAHQTCYLPDSMLMCCEDYGLYSVLPCDSFIRSLCSSCMELVSFAFTDTTNMQLS